MLCLFDVLGDMTIVSTMIYHTIEQQIFKTYVDYSFLLVTLQYTTSDIDRIIISNKCYIDISITCLNANVQSIAVYGIYSGYVYYIDMKYIYTISQKLHTLRRQYSLKTKASSSFWGCH